MSTRCNIIVKDKYNSIQLYRHCDGHPEGKCGVIEALKEVLPYAWELPTMEADDFSAAIIRAWKKEGGGNIYIDGTADIPNTLHGDINYYYVITPDYEIGNWKVECISTYTGKTVWSGHIGDEF